MVNIHYKLELTLKEEFQNIESAARHTDWLMVKKQPVRLQVVNKSWLAVIGPLMVIDEPIIFQLDNIQLFPSIYLLAYTQPPYRKLLKEHILFGTPLHSNQSHIFL